MEITKKFTTIVTVEAKYLHATFQPVSFEDAEVNGVEENNDAPKMFGIKVKEGSYPEFIYSGTGDQRYVEWMIDVDEGRIIDWPEDMEATIYYKPCDMGEYELLTDEEDFIGYISDDYVPDCLQIDDEGYGDYVYITVEKGGRIKNWDPERIELIGNQEFDE